MRLGFKQVKDFDKEFYGWFTSNRYTIQNAKDLQDAFYEDHTVLPLQIVYPYRNAFEFYAEDFNFSDFNGSEYHELNATPIGLRHIQCVKNGPKFEFLCGWMGGGNYPDVMVIFYLNQKGVPSLYIPISGNPISSSTSKVYQYGDSSFKSFLDTNGDFIHDFNKMRRELHDVFGFKA